MSAAKVAAPPEAAEQTLSTQDWIDAARRMLVRDGVGALKVDRLARECNVTRGGFYWRFKSREDLLDKLLDEWRRVNTNPLLAALGAPGGLRERLCRVADLWLREEEFDPMFDTAVRAWGTASAKAAAVVREIDDVRLGAFQKAFEEAGYEPTDALVRARVTYFCQVGYYALGIHENTQRRQDLVPRYIQVYMGPDHAGEAARGERRPRSTAKGGRAAEARLAR